VRIRSRTLVYFAISIGTLSFAAGCSQDEVDDLNKSINDLNQDLKNLEPTIDSILENLDETLTDLENSLNS